METTFIFPFTLVLVPADALLEISAHVVGGKDSLPHAALSKHFTRDQKIPATARRERPTLLILSFGTCSFKLTTSSFDYFQTSKAAASRRYCVIVLPPSDM